MDSIDYIVPLRACDILYALSPDRRAHTTTFVTQSVVYWIKWEKKINNYKVQKQNGIAFCVWLFSTV